MTQLKIGQKAPDFTLTDSKGDQFNLYSFISQSQHSPNLLEAQKTNKTTEIETQGEVTNQNPNKKYKRILLYFYPKDNTPGCTIQAKNFNELSSGYEQQGTKIIGISPDNQKSHLNFASKFCLTLDLLCDVEHQAAEKYGVWQEKRMFLKKYMGIVRSSFLINCSDMKLEMIWSPVKGVATHGTDVLAFIAKMP